MQFETSLFTEYRTLEHVLYLDKCESSIYNQNYLLYVINNHVPIYLSLELRIIEIVR
jgi:hypothetical protein